MRPIAVSRFSSPLLIIILQAFLLAAEPVHASAGPSFTHIGTSHTFGTPQTPFWLHANRDGRIPLYSGNNFLFFGEHHSSLLPEASRWDLDTGFRLDSRLSDAGNMLAFTELYAHIRTRGLQLSIGRFYDTIGHTSGYLTTGSLLMSRNARQPYKLRISTPDFVPVPLTGGTVSFKIRWSEALLTDDRFVDRARIHQKYLYLKVKPVSELHLTAGIVHNLMWGGTHPEMGKLHTIVRDWLSDVLAQPDDAASGNVTPKGNGLGGYDFGAEYRGSSWSVGAWRLFYIEDGQSMNLRSPWDGMWGVYFDRNVRHGSRRLIEFVTYEHVNTKYQDGGGFKAIGRARFYTHRVWRDGWVHHGQVLGTPLILIDPSKAGTRDQLLVNNIVLAHHLGLAGHLGRSLSYELLGTYSRNYGICRDQTSGGSCGGSVEEPVWERDGYVPYHTLRRDRYSFMVRMEAPVNLLLDLLPGGSSGGSSDGSAAASPRIRNPGGEGAGARSQTARLPAGHSQRNFGATPSVPQRGLRMHISFALDAGAFHSRTVFGMEAGLTFAL